MKLSEFLIHPVRFSPGGPIAFCSFVYNDEFKMRHIAIYPKKAGGFRLLFPARKINGMTIQSFYPITSSVTQKLENVTSQRLEEIFDRPPQKRRSEQIREHNF